MEYLPFRPPTEGNRVGEYLVVGELGRGGQGLVYKVECGGHFYALKFIQSRQLLSSGEREIDILRRLTGVENVVRFKGCGWWPNPETGWLYIVLELVEGWTLEEYARVCNPSARVAGRLFLELGRTLVEVERRGVRHRDLKRENILVREADGRPVLVDFGVGEMAGVSNFAAEGGPRGTTEYVSPEAWRRLEEKGEWGEYEPGLGDELWALGVTFYWLLMGRLPFGTRARMGAMMKGVLEHTPQVPHARNPRIPPALGEVCMRLLEKQPAARYPSLEALCAALEAALASMEGDARWDEPLEDPDAPENQTTDALAELAHDSWARFQQELNAARPRRGRVRKPAPVLAAAPVMAAPEPSVPQLLAPQATHAASPAGPVPVSPPEAKRSRWWGAWAGVSVVVALVGALVFSVTRGRVSEPVGEVAERAVSPLARWLPDTSTAPACLVQEVAAGWPPSEAGEGAALFLASTPAPMPAMLLRQQATPAQRSAKPAPPPLQKARGCAPLLTRMCTAGLCTLWLSGCTGAPVRPPRPQPADCPPGALAVMDALEIRRECSVYLTDPQRDEDAEVTVPLGRITYKTGRRGWGGLCGNLPPGTRLSGAFFLGTVEGKTVAVARLTQAQTPEGKTYPVCMTVGEYEAQGGAPILRPGDKPGTVVVTEWISAFQVEERFE